ncbi:MAG: hypothetical protein IKN01_01355 [Prevotella sp.]|nr:hypothetical protein [Prevotella sp.]
MNKKKYYSIFFIALFLSILPLCKLAAQEQQTEDTHAHSSSLKWKGINVDDVINKNYTSKGKKIFLYNVGTGRFIIEGGNWGMEGRLFHETFGRPMELWAKKVSNKYYGIIKSGITLNNDKNLFGCNAPGAFHSQKNWTNYDQYSFGIMMDARKGTRNGWTFIRVEEPNNTETYTYYMYETSNQQTTEIDYTANKYYLGAAYGEWKKDNSNTETDKLVYRDHDRATWTTKENVINITTPYEVKNEFNTEMIPLNELYQWRLVSEEEYLSMLDNVEIGLNPSVSVLIYDRDFVRNAEQFDSKWITEDKSGFAYDETDNSGRFGYTFGSTGNKYNPQQEQYYDEAWNKPLRLKNIFETGEENAVGYRYGLKYGKYGFLTFEGVGRTYTEVTVPRAGWYLVQCYGFVYSDSGHDAYLFAKVDGSNETSSTGGESKKNLRHISTSTLSNEVLTGKNDREKCLEVGKFLTQPKTSESEGETKEEYLTTLWICVTQEQFEKGIKTLRIGIGKDEASQSAGIVNNGKTYYYDTDWVCVDDFRMSYLGLRPAFFYEDEENLNYLDPTSSDYIDSETKKAKQYQGASPTGQYAGAICIERSLMTDQWNTFSFPMPLTGEQIRQAFGEDAQLAYIHSVGGLSQHDNVIDFQTKTLFTSETVVEPGQFYLLKPTKLPLKGIDPRGREAEYYELGRKYFSVNDEPDSYKHDLLAVGTKMENKETIKLGDGRQGGTASVTYVQTSDVTNFHVNSDGIYTGTNIYAPKGSYAVSVKSDKATIFHLKRDTPIKGFRGWINLDDELDQQSSKEFSMEIYGMFFKEPSGVTTDAELPSIQILSNDEAVYDLTGRKVGTLGKNLPKGIYIVKGKKFFVN